jgi:hypothetical protein
MQLGRLKLVKNWEIVAHEHNLVNLESICNEYRFLVENFTIWTFG